MARPCSHEDSKLKCIQCDTSICGQCMIECPVGFRCATCVSPRNTTAKTTEYTWKVPAKAFGASVLVGVAAAWVMTFVHVPFIDCLISFFLGIYSGRWLTQFLDRRLGDRTALTVVFGTLFGMCFSPQIFIPYIIFEILGAMITGTATIPESLLAVVSILFTPACFYAGILRPTVWGEF
jgi:hypothetical protein